MLYYASGFGVLLGFWGLFWFSSLPVEMFGFRILHTSVLLRGIHQLLKIPLQELVSMWFESCEH